MEPLWYLGVWSQQAETSVGREMLTWLLPRPLHMCANTGILALGATVPALQAPVAVAASTSASGSGNGGRGSAAPS